MDAYILGTHEGDLPTHLLEQGELGNRVRVMAALAGPEHSAYYAIEAPTQEALDEHVSTIATSGTTTQLVLVPCVTEPCLRANDGVNHGPCFLPPWLCHLFLVIHTETLENTLPAIIERLGRDNVAAANNGDGTFLVELAGDDQAEVEAAANQFLEATAAEHSGLHFVTGGLIKA